MFAAKLRKSSHVCVKLIENIPYVLVNITRILQTRTKFPHTFLRFATCASNDVTNPRSFGRRHSNVAGNLAGIEQTSHDEMYVRPLL